jgi:sorbitol-specific phosphotransferase system component IIBC
MEPRLGLILNPVILTNHQLEALRNQYSYSPAILSLIDCARTLKSLLFCKLDDDTLIVAAGATPAGKVLAEYLREQQYVSSKLKVQEDINLI